MPADPTYEPGRPASRSQVARRQGKARVRYKPPPLPQPVQRSARTQTPQQRVAARKRARAVIRHGGRVIQPSRRGPAQETQPGAEEFFGEARLPKERPGQVVPELSTSGLERLPPGLTGGPQNLFGRILGNLGADVADVVTGTPSAVMLAAKTTAYPVFKLTGQEGAQDIESDIGQAGRAIGRDYATRWGPLFRGDLGEFAHQAGEHPGLLAADVAGAYSAAGVGARLAAKGAGAATRSATLSRIGSKSAVTHARPVKRRTVLVGPQTKMGRKGPGVATVEIAQRPYSVTNPITRGIQKAVTRGAERFERRVVREAEKGRVGYQRLRQFRYDFGATRQARDMRQAAEGAVSQGVRTSPTVRSYVQAVKDLDAAGRPRPGAVRSRWGKDQVDAALELHARDLLRVPGKTPRQALNQAIATRRKGLDEMVQRHGIDSKGPEAELAKWASVPDELLDLKGPVKELRPAVEAYRTLAREATARRVAAKTLAPEAAAQVPSRAARMTHAGLRYDPKAKAWVEPPRVAGGAVARQEVPGLPAPAHAKAGALRSPLDPYADVGREAVYVKDVAAPGVFRGKGKQAKGQFGRITQDKDYASHGVLFRAGLTAADRGLPIKALERALADELHPRFVNNVKETFAFRRPDGKFVRNKRAIAAMEADEDNVILLGEKSFNDALARIRDLPEGEMPNSPFDGIDMFEGSRDLSQARAYRANGGKLIAFPKSAVEGIRNGWERVPGGGTKVGKGFDTAQQLWKRGILAFAPRWYLNSLFGNTFMYGMATGGDMRAIVAATRQGRRHADEFGPEYEARVRGATNVAEAQIGERAAPRGTAKYRAITDRLMGKQASFDALFRRALYINRMKQGLRREGVKVRGLSPDDLAEAFRTAPKQVKDQAVRDVELFLGDYLRLSPVERGVFRRVAPFYSWMRVIGRFTLEVPIRHPKRTALLAATSRAAAEVENPLDPGQSILANRGRAMLPGGLAARTAGANPLFTHADIIKGIAGQDVQGTVGSLASNLSPIGLQQLARNFGGTTAFGAPVSFPPGYQGAVSSFGMDPMRIDPVTGAPDYFTPTVPLEEQLLQTIPLLPGLARGLASGGREPYDVTTTRQLIENALRWGGGNKDLLFEPERGRAMSPIPGVSPFLSLTGVPLQRYNRAEDIKAIRKRQENIREAARQTRRRRRRAAR